MKTKTLQNILNTRALTRTIAVALVATAAGAYAQASKQQDSATKLIAPEQKLLVNVDDLVGMTDLDREYIRENLLQNAFYEAAEDKDWIGKYDFRYNYNIPKDREGYLEFNVVDWERTVTNMYECTLSATYHTVGGEEINLGFFHATEPGIAVVTGWDISDQFEKAAESAFRQALEKLKDEALGS